MIDFELPGEVAKLRDRVDGFIAEQIVPYENDKRQSAHGPSEELRREMVALARGRTTVAAWAARMGRPGPRPSRHGGRIRGRRMVAAGTARAQHSGARRGQHQSAQQDRDARAKGAMARGRWCAAKFAPYSR